MHLFGLEELLDMLYGDSVVRDIGGSQHKVHCCIRALVLGMLYVLQSHGLRLVRLRFRPPSAALLCCLQTT